MDTELRLEDVALAAEEAQCGEIGEAQDGLQLNDLVRDWGAGPGEKLSDADILSWYDALSEAHWSETLRRSQSGRCMPCDGTSCFPDSETMSNTSLGWGSWLFDERRPQLIASEDGLMLNTGIVLARASVWTWIFFQKVRGMTFGSSPVTHHPWWEQTAMVYLLQMPFTLMHAKQLSPSPTDLGPPEEDRGYSAALFLLSQRHINSYPTLVASALKTHAEYEAGDFIISFSGCKVYSSQEVCNQLFLHYFFKVHSLQELSDDPALRSWL